MFGEDVILGYKNCKLDSKGRIILPKFTFATEDDEIGITRENNGYIGLYNYNILKHRIKDLKTESLSKKNEELIQYIESQLEEIFAKFITTSVVDTQRRLLIPKELLDSQGFSENAILQGAYDHARLFTDEDRYNQYIRKFTQTKK